jgi:hypothetical protein
MTTKRCNAEERKAFKARYPYSDVRKHSQHGEPALGTLEERLNIVIRRLGEYSHGIGHR